MSARRQLASKIKDKGFMPSRSMVVADDEFLAVSEGRIRIRIGAFAVSYTHLTLPTKA